MPKKNPKKSAKKPLPRLTPKKSVQDLLKVEKDLVKKTKIRVIGIGGGGGSIVSEIASRMKKASFVVANTDLQALRATSRKALHFHFGQNFTHGLGTGMNSEIGREAAQNEKDKIKKLLEGQDLCIIVASLGGGTGSGAAPVFAKISKDLGSVNYGIFTLPFKFEGEKKMEIARESLKKIKTHLNAITIIPNERIFQVIDKSTPLNGALSAINKILSRSLEGLIETIYEPGLINIDFADFRTILQGRGRLAYLNTVEVQRKESSDKDLITQVLHCPLYPYGIRGAKGVLFNIAGEKKLSLAEVGQISKTISELVNPEAKIIFGIAQSKKYSDIIKTTLLATGCGMKLFPTKPKKKRIKKKVIKEIPVIEEKKEKKVTKRKKRKKRGEKRTKGKKIKLKKVKELKKESSSEPGSGAEQKTLSNNEEKVRKNALQIKKEAEKEEQEMLAKEKSWEPPAFLRKKLAKNE